MSNSRPLEFIELLENLAKEMKQEKDLLPADCKTDKYGRYNLEEYVAAHKKEESVKHTRTIMALYNAMKYVSTFLRTNPNYITIAWWGWSLRTVLMAIDDTDPSTFVPVISDEKTYKWGKRYKETLETIMAHESPFTNLSSTIQGLIQISKFQSMQSDLAMRVGMYEHDVCLNQKKNENTLQLKTSTAPNTADEKMSRMPEIKTAPITEFKRQQPPIADKITQKPPIDEKKITTEFLTAREELEKKLDVCLAKTSRWDRFWGNRNDFNDHAEDIRTALVSLRHGAEKKITTLSITCFDTAPLDNILGEVLTNYINKRNTLLNFPDLDTSRIAKYDLKRILSDIPNHSSFWGFLGFGNVFNAMQSHVPALLELLASEPIKSNEFKALANPFTQVAAAYSKDLTDEQKTFVNRLTDMLTTFEKYTVPASPMRNNVLDKFIAKEEKGNPPESSLSLSAKTTVAPLLISPILEHNNTDNAESDDDNDEEKYYTPTSRTRHEMKPTF